LNDDNNIATDEIFIVVHVWLYTAISVCLDEVYLVSYVYGMCYCSSRSICYNISCHHCTHSRNEFKLYIYIFLYRHFLHWLFKFTRISLSSCIVSLYSTKNFCYCISIYDVLYWLGAKLPHDI